MTIRYFAVWLGALALVGCDFSKEPYLFTSLADVPFFVTGDAGPPAAPDATDTVAEAGAADAEAADGGLIADDATAPDAAPPTEAGRAVRFSAIEQGLVGDGAGFMPSEGHPRTVETWVRGLRAPRSARLFGYGPSDRRFDFYMIVSGDEGWLILYDALDAVTSTRTPLLAGGGWHHVAVTMTATRAPDSRSEVAFYVDGVLITRGSKGPNDVPRAEARRLIIGGTPGDPIGFAPADLDEVRLWSVVRTPAEIAANQRVIVRDAPGLVGYWPLDAQGRGPGIAFPNMATVTGTAAAPNLVSGGDVETIGDPPF
jgi:hypothetical protein